MKLNKAGYRNLSSRHMFSPYGPPPQSNGTNAGTTDNSESNQNVASTIAIASILPILIAIFLLVMVVMFVNSAFCWSIFADPINRALLLPRLSLVELAASKEERRKRRMERLNSFVSSQNFRDWRTKEIAAHPDSVISTEPLWWANTADKKVKNS